MCNKKVYNRFLKLSKYHSKNGHINHIVYDTKLGKRDVYISKPDYKDKSIDVLYYDGASDYLPDVPILFFLNINKSGKIEIKVNRLKIDEPAIFLAIYEIECIINDKKKKNIDSILEKLFENVDEYNFSNNIFSFTQYR